MFQPKLRRALASAALVSALSLIPLGDAGAAPRSRKEGRKVSGRITVPNRLFSLWDLLAHVLAKDSVRIDPDGNSAQADPNEPNAADKAGVRIDPDGRH